jgi:phospholipid/cholesterol/gamma-HCH transport system ATP-binding protein
VLDPEIVMFDEPDSGLDPVRTAFLSELIRDLNAQLGMCSVVVTHDIATCRRVADYIGMLAQGKLVKFGSAKEMFESEIPVVRQFLAGDTVGPIGMAEEKDEDILGEAPSPKADDTVPDAVEAKSSMGMTAEETEEMERAAGANDGPAEDDKGDELKEGEDHKQGSGLPDAFSLEKMLRNERDEEQG